MLVHTYLVLDYPGGISKYRQIDVVCDELYLGAIFCIDTHPEKSKNKNITAISKEWKVHMYTQMYINVG